MDTIDKCSNYTYKVISPPESREKTKSNKYDDNFVFKTELLYGPNEKYYNNKNCNFVPIDFKNTFQDIRVYILVFFLM